eukprot:CAMPEP_0206413094 /NCGR_PEP_ID=MMETSP0294-20121207/34441_1 /ASSEMBLY_ACC=CAM_ASM_000327 /TAXON_ID=39354 /ORGANISM="Heterosigma akashiwo, Strain CCMP2393" /LENGTH=75 /DNA_ID=CAMNT_0053874481 /DNA_START=411 /DNA_END=635 /DNA_ORIENTATION=-
MKYKNLDEAIEKTIEIFLEATKSLIERKGFQAYVHPIIPVLEPTRQIVKKYNLALRRAVRRGRGGPRLAWLPCFD